MIKIMTTATTATKIKAINTIEEIQALDWEIPFSEELTALTLEAKEEDGFFYPDTLLYEIYAAFEEFNEVSISGEEAHGYLWQAIPAFYIDNA